MNKTQKNHPKTIIVEGNMGAGKSTFLNIVAQKLDVQIVPEPCAKWQNIGEHNLLDFFYKDPKRWAYTFQSYAFISRIFAQREYAQQEKNIAVQIPERSVYSDRFCFAKNCFESGLMTELEWNVYRDLFAWFVDELMSNPVGFIYLRTTPETCFERMKKRNRSEETNVSLDYLTQIHDRHEQWLIKKHDIPAKFAEIPVLTLDVNNEFEMHPANAQKMMDQVQEFINQVTMEPVNNGMTPSAIEIR